ncbi:hypothetical protein OTU49_009476 [Cherax quadricarinatus]|uniref:Uncharacterized protein n=1 Tax=Cherax quadricarinatus TaxID=27406 RepID=A0AAW0WJH9_CHEQU
MESIAVAAPAMTLSAEAPLISMLPEIEDTASQNILSRKRRTNFADISDLNSDGNFQKEMVFAFAAAMLSTIPILLGNENDVNAGVRKKRQIGPYQELHDPDFRSYISYTQSPEEFSTMPFFSGYTYKRIMTSSPGTDFFHIHNSSTTTPDTDKDATAPLREETGVVNDALGELLKDLLKWSQEKVKNKPLLPLLIDLALDKYSGNPNPADKLVRTAYKKWKNYWY